MNNWFFIYWPQCENRCIFAIGGGGGSLTEITIDQVKMMYMFQIYIFHLIDWYQHWRNRLSSFGGEANTNYYPSNIKIHKIKVYRDLDLQSWRGEGQN